MFNIVYHRDDSKTTKDFADYTFEGVFYDNALEVLILAIGMGCLSQGSIKNFYIALTLAELLTRSIIDYGIIQLDFYGTSVLVYP